MAFINCPECGRSVSDKAQACPGCGYPFKPSAALPPGAPAWLYGAYEYKSKATIFGMPLVHIVSGMAPGGRLKPAKGFIAIGNIAIGIIAVGGAAVGVLCFAGVGIGLISFAGLAIGLGAAFGGLAVGYIAAGGIAIGIYAVGGLTYGAHTLYNDPQFREYLRSLFNWKR
jgi:hypothetical protein